MRQIGPYRVLEELGRGAMGVVYRAQDPTLDRTLAIKIIRGHEFDSPEEVSEAGVRLAREASAAGRLSHPNIVALYQFGQEPEFDYIAMEFVPGASLDKTLKAGRRYTPAEVVEIVGQVAGALDHAHANGVVHRDIKPANILARPDGVFKVTDFGIARLTSQTITRTGAAMGTPAYMAPEQIDGAKVDARADQFSLAVVAHQLFTATLPFAGASDIALLMQILRAEPASLRDAHPELPVEAERAVRRALAKNPGERFRSCGEFARALQSAFSIDGGFDPEATVRSIPTVLREAGTATAGVKRPRRGRSAVVGMVVFCCVAAGLAVIYNRPASEKRESKPPAVTTPAAEQREPFLNPADQLRYVWIPPGSFTMGCSAGEDCYGGEAPRSVAIGKGFWLGQTEVTQAAYQRVRNVNPSHFKGGLLPVESITFADAGGYCQAIGGRLPTEEEWEYAARGGGAAANERNAATKAWMRDNSGGSPHPVGTKRSNGFDLYDMLGNVWEWVANPGGNSSSGTIRGGSFANDLKYATASSRRSVDLTTVSEGVGFRCAGDFR